MNVRTSRNVTEATRVVGGEIVTSPQFQSVKDAVNLFRKGAFSENKPSIQKKTLAKETTDLHWSQKEVNKLKNQMQNTDTTESHALTKLENAKEMLEDLQLQYPERVSETGASFQKEMGIARVSDLEKLCALCDIECDSEIAENLKLEMGMQNSNLEFVRIVARELLDAKEELQKAKEEESSLRDLLESLKLQLEIVKREHFELKKKECLSGSIYGSLYAKLRKSRSGLEEERYKFSISDELWQEEEELKKEQSKHGESEENVRIALKESESKIVLSREEYESLIRRAEESDMVTNMKIMAANAETEAVKASESETLKKLKMFEKEMADARTAAEEALERASMAEMAKMAAEGELRKKKIESVAEILSNSKIESGSDSEKVTIPKLKRNSASRRTLLLPNLSGMFQKRKNEREETSATILSYLGDDMFF